MVRHNNPICNNHFRKDWQRYVKTWFDQPAKKSARRAARVAKAKRVHPRPVNALRPVVRSQTVKYNTKVRAGRGFTLEELRAAGVAPKKAAGLAVSVDHRRKNRSEEAFAHNVARLKAYLAKVVVLKKTSEAAEFKQVTSKQSFAITPTAWSTSARAITEKELSAPSVVDRLRQAHTDAKKWGRREKALSKKAANKLASDKKASKKSDE